MSLRRDHMAFRRLSVGVTIGAIGAVFLMGTAVVPLALHIFADISWSDLSDVGQAYGGLAAILATLSLGAVAISVFLQARETRTAQEHGARLLHLELVRMSLDDPTLLRKSGVWPRELPVDEIRYHINQNLWLMLWRTLHKLGNMSERELRLALADELFHDARGQRFWIRSREIQLASIRNRRDSRFYDIVEDEYQKSLAHAHPGGWIRRSTPNQPTWRAKPPLIAASALFGALAGYAIYRARTTQPSTGKVFSVRLLHQLPQRRRTGSSNSYLK